MNDDQQMAQNPAKSAEPTVKITAGQLPDAHKTKPGDELKIGSAGTMFLDRYEMIEIVGRGGMSVVYKAKHLMLERFIAIKLLHPHLATDENALKRFKQEAKSASQLKHDGIIGITDFGVTEQGQPYLIMEFVDGCSLADVLDKEECEPARALNLVNQICLALAHAHKAGIVHRDIKPSNVLVLDRGTPKERIKVCDFGIAKMLEDDQSRHSLTQTGESIGSPPYMSPEQCQGAALDARSDVYSTGCLLYELICGEPPFRGGSIFETIHMQITAMPPSVRKARPNIADSTVIDALILRALEKRSSHRYQSMEEFASEIQNVVCALHERPSLAKRIQSHFPIIASRLRSRNTQLAGLIAIAILAPSVVSAVLLTQKSSKTTSTIVADAPVTIERAPNPNKEKFQRLFDAGKEFIDQQQYPAAIESLTQAQQVGARAIGMQNKHYQACLASLSEAYSKNGQVKLADTTVSELKRLQEYAPDLGTINANADLISETNSRLTDDPKNETLIGQLGTLYFNQGSLYLLDNEYKRSLRLSEESLRMNEIAFGPQSQIVGETLINMAAAYTETGNFQEAEKCLERVEKIANGLSASAPQLLALTHYRKGRINWHYANIADDAKRTGAAHTQLIPGHEDPIKEATAAVNEFTTAQKFFSTLYGEQSPRFADASIQRGAAESILGDWKNSLAHLAEGIPIIEAYYGPDHTKVGKAHWYFADALHRSARSVTPIAKDQAKQAELHFRLAQTIFEQNSRDLEHSSLVAICMLERGKIQQELGALPQAEALLRAAFTISKGDGVKSSICVRATNALPSVLKEQGKDKESAAIMREMQVKTLSPIQPPHTGGNLRENISDDDQ